MFARTIISFLLIASTAFATVSAEGCFSGGQVGDCSSTIGDFCSSLGGSMNTNEQRTRCYNVNGFKCDMRVINKGNANVPQEGDCDAALQSVTGCSNGGIKTINNFEFTMDPNTGSC